MNKDAEILSQVWHKINKYFPNECYRRYLLITDVSHAAVKLFRGQV